MTVRAAMAHWPIWLAVLLPLVLLLPCVLALVARASPPPTSDSSAPAQWLANAEAALHAGFPNIQADHVSRSPVPSLLEISSGAQLMYYAPEGNLLVIGELIDRDGQSLTQAKLDRLQRKAIPSDAGARIGTGEVEIIAFVDPDCGYCSRAAAWLQLQPNLLIRMLFLPMAADSSAASRARAFVCLPEAARMSALTTLFSRRPVPRELRAACSDADAQLQRHAEVATAAGIRATPTFFIGDQTVQGFDPARLTAALAAVQPHIAPRNLP